MSTWGKTCVEKPVSAFKDWRICWHCCEREELSFWFLFEMKRSPEKEASMGASAVAVLDDILDCEENTRMGSWLEWEGI